MRIQSKLMSLWESWFNVIVGFGINYVANLTVLPLFGIYIDPIDNIWIGIIYTAISVTRSFLIRRYMNFKSEKKLSEELKDVLPQS